MACRRFWCQVIIWTKVGLLPIGPFGTNTNFSIDKNAHDNIVCEMAAILSGGDELKVKSVKAPSFPVVLWMMPSGW